MLTPLSQYFSLPSREHHHVCHDGIRYVSRHEISDHVAMLANAYRNCHEHRWLLAEPSPLAFLTRFFALLHAGKEIVIPPNFQPGTLAALRHAYDDDAATVKASDDALKLTPLVSASCHIHLYTSGSTGTPKLISKTLAQFEREIVILEQLWAGQLADATVIASVPHHHIYGLLFRLLWPLASGRVFDCETSTMPDQLLNRSQFFGNSILVSSPAQLTRLPELMPLQALAPHISCIFSSGGPLSAESATRYRDVWSQSPVEIFGSTETGGIAWRRQNNDTTWTAFPGMQIKQDTDGAMLLQSPILKNQAFIRLEDAISILPGQRFTLQGRLDRIVKLEEKRLSLPELENILASHPWVHQCAALVIQRQRLAIAVVLVLSGATVEEWQSLEKTALVKVLRQFLAQHFDTVLLPRYWRLVDALPLTERGKVSFNDIKHLFEEESADETAA